MPSKVISRLTSRNGIPISADNRLLPDGRKVADVRPGEMARLLIKAGVPAITHEMGKHQLAQRYHEFLEGIEAEGGARGVSEWMIDARAKAAA